MKTSKQMQSIISKIAEKHGLDLKNVGGHLKLQRNGYMPLVIETVGKNLVSVAHYFEQNGDLVADPDAVFFTGYAEWVPTEITQVLGYQCVAWVNEEGTAIEKLKPASQADVARFTEMWGHNIKAQGWLEMGIKHGGKPSHQCFTFGYAGANPDALESRINELGAILIDIRAVAFSRMAVWSKSQLRQRFGDSYLHVPELGNIHYKDGLPMEIADLSAGISIVLEQLSRRPVVLMCGCKDAAMCHRSYVANEVAKSDLQVSELEI